jgi:hypothetical protein
MAANMLESPETSLPTQNPKWSDLKAAYRLCDQEEVTFDAVAECHWKQTRHSGPGRYLLISDTTDIDHFGHKATQGLSHLGKGDGRGMQLHSCLMVEAATGLVRGLAGALVHYRPIVPKQETRMQRLKRDRESEIWGKLVDAVGSAPPQAQWIHVFDRGGDNYEAMCHIQKTGADWVIRAAKLNRTVKTASGVKQPLKQALESAKLLGTYQLALRSRPGQGARTATLEVSTIRVMFPRPRHHSAFVKQCGVTAIAMNVVIVQETNPPPGVTPIRWILLTSLPIESFQDAWQVIEYYEYRWLIEEYHKVLKTGCSVERPALRTADRLEPLLALTSVIGVRLLQLKTIAKREPTAKACHRIPSSWLRALQALRPRLQVAKLSVHEFFRELAKLGGFLGRKHDGEPGWQTTWRGYQKLHGIIEALRIAAIAP